MKLGKKINLINIFVITLIMICSFFYTIKYLYNNNNITKEEYLELLLSDMYKDDFYIKLVEVINKNFNPLNMIEIDEVTSNNLNLHNEINYNPVIYIYSLNPELYYEDEYNIKPNITLATYFLNKHLLANNINSIFEDNDIITFSKNNNITIDNAVNFFLNDKLNNYSSIKYIINLDILNENDYNVLEYNNKKYAIINFYANEDNIALIKKLNNKLNEKYEGISKIYFDDSYNRFINISFGNKKNTFKEVLNSIELFSSIFKEEL